MPDYFKDFDEGKKPYSLIKAGAKKSSVYYQYKLWNTQKKKGVVSEVSKPKTKETTTLKITKLENEKPEAEKFTNIFKNINVSGEIPSGNTGSTPPISDIGLQQNIGENAGNEGLKEATDKDVKEEGQRIEVEELTGVVSDVEDTIFTKVGLPGLTDREKEKISNNFGKIAENRVNLYTKNADLINGGISIGAPILRRIGQVIEIAKKRMEENKKKDIENSKKIKEEIEKKKIADKAKAETMKATGEAEIKKEMAPAPQPEPEQVSVQQIPTTQEELENVQKQIFEQYKRQFPFSYGGR